MLYDVIKMKLCWIWMGFFPQLQTHNRRGCQNKSQSNVVVSKDIGRRYMAEKLPIQRKIQNNQSKGVGR